MIVCKGRLLVQHQQHACTGASAVSVLQLVLALVFQLVLEL